MSCSRILRVETTGDSVSKSASVKAVAKIKHFLNRLSPQLPQGHQHKTQNQKRKQQAFIDTLLGAIAQERDRPCERACATISAGLDSFDCERVEVHSLITT